VFFLTWEELQQAALQSASVDLQDQLKTRAARHKVLETLTPPARIPDVVPITIRRKVISWIKPFIVGRSAKSQDGVLWGAPVSPGLATGPARIMFTVDDVHELNPGDILVTPAATPEWTSAFCVVAGLVTDIGGPLSHSSIIAREFGVPTVMGVRIATTTISEGQLITVDGASGSVWLREKSI
jgi:phosphoenolpyruvate synthase/pyruvate phosphate dikinase